jgi:VanZ family protein
LIHDADDDRQLVIGQWQRSLVIMNGDDYSNELRKPKIYLELDTQQTKKHFLGIVSNAGGTRVFLDGALIKRNAALMLKYPPNRGSARMVLGNSLRGEHPWRGTIEGLAFYDRALSDEILAQHYQRWRLAHDFGEFAADGPRLLYAFDEGHGQRVENKVGDGLDLKVPAWRKILHKQVLSWPRWETVERYRGFRDAFVNFIGFMPLGFLLMATVGNLVEGIGFRWALMATLLVVFMFSLGIEIVQVWIPTRYSSLLDLILNTFGGGSGAVLFGKLKAVRLPQNSQRYP